jgi:hypothetical protein
MSDPSRREFVATALATAMNYRDFVTNMPVNTANKL